MASHSNLGLLSHIIIDHNYPLTRNLNVSEQPHITKRKTVKVGGAVSTMNITNTGRGSLTKLSQHPLSQRKGSLQPATITRLPKGTIGQVNPLIVFR